MSWREFGFFVLGACAGADSIHAAALLSAA
jgi:hypothetical protein